MIEVEAFHDRYLGASVGALLGQLSRRAGFQIPAAAVGVRAEIAAADEALVETVTGGDRSADPDLRLRGGAGVTRDRAHVRETTARHLIQVRPRITTSRTTMDTKIIQPLPHNHRSPSPTFRLVSLLHRLRPTGKVPGLLLRLRRELEEIGCQACPCPSPRLVGPVGRLCLHRLLHRYRHSITIRPIICLNTGSMAPREITEVDEVAIAVVVAVGNVLRTIIENHIPKQTKQFAQVLSAYINVEKV